jgi:hypothetical protein
MHTKWMDAGVIDCRALRLTINRKTALSDVVNAAYDAFGRHHQCSFPTANVPRGAWYRFIVDALIDHHSNIGSVKPAVLKRVSRRSPIEREAAMRALRFAYQMHIGIEYPRLAGLAKVGGELSFSELLSEMDGMIPSQKRTGIGK